MCHAVAVQFWEGGTGSQAGGGSLLPPGPPLSQQHPLPDLSNLEVPTRLKATSAHAWHHCKMHLIALAVSQMLLALPFSPGPLANRLPLVSRGESGRLSRRAVRPQP